MSDWFQAQLFLEAFFVLSTTRSYGAMGGILPISWREVMYYADRIGLDGASADHLWEIIRGLDMKHVRDVNQEVAAKNRPPPTGNRDNLPRPR